MTGRFFDLFTYDFALRGLIAGLCAGVACSALGVILVLRRISLIGDGLSHVTFLGAVIAVMMGASPIYVSLPVVMASSLLIFKLMEKTRVYGDAAIGMVSAGGLAGGILLAGLGGGFNADIFGFLFGNILSVKAGEVWLSVILLVLTLGFIGLKHRELTSVTFDEDFAKTSGVDTAKLSVAMVMAVSAAVVLAIKISGAMLTSALVIIPAVTAIQIGRGFGNVIATACVVSAVSIIFGLSVSFAFNLPSGAAIVLLNILFFLASITLKRLRKAN